MDVDFFNDRINEEIKKKYLEINDNENTSIQNCSKSSRKREVHSDTDLSQKTRKIPNKQLKGIRKTKPEVIKRRKLLSVFLV